MRDAPALSFTIVRILIAGAVLILLALRLPRPRLSSVPWRSLAAAGLAQTAFQLLLFEGLARTSASISAILLATAPLMTAVWLVARGQQRMGPLAWLGLGMGLAGVALVVRTDGTGLAGTTLVGNLIAIGAAVAWAWYGLVIGPLARAIGPVGATATSLTVSALVLTPLGLPELLSVNWAGVSAPAWVGILYGSLLGLVLATLLWVRSIQRWGTQPTMNYGYVEPVAAVAIAALLLGEALHPLQGIGALLALTGVYLASEMPLLTASEPASSEKVTRSPVSLD